MLQNTVAYLFLSPGTGFMCHLYTATKYAIRKPVELLWGENHAYCHRIVHKTYKKHEKGECKERKRDVSA